MKEKLNAALKDAETDDFESMSKYKCERNMHFFFDLWVDKCEDFLN